MDKNNNILMYCGKPLYDWDSGTLSYLDSIYCGPHNRLRYYREVYDKIHIPQQQFKRILNDLIFQKELEETIGSPEF